jgi:hypothetical protein
VNLNPLGWNTIADAAMKSVTLNRDEQRCTEQSSAEQTYTMQSAERRKPHEQGHRRGKVQSQTSQH